MDEDAWLPRLDKQLDEDLVDIVCEVLESTDMEDLFSLLRWPPSVIAELRKQIISDRDFRRRLLARYDKVIDQATSLDEHNNRRPKLSEDNFVELLEKPRPLRLVLLAVGILATAIVLPILILPDIGLLRFTTTLLVGAGLYYLPLAQKILAVTLPNAIWDRIQWGRRRRRLRLGISLLRWDWKTTVRNEIVLPEVIERVNSGTPRVFSQDLRIHNTWWPRATGTLSFLIPTKAVDRLSGELSRMTSGAIALAGRRGVGKTTLLQALESNLLPHVDQAGQLTVLVPAPADTSYGSSSYTCTRWYAGRYSTISEPPRRPLAPVRRIAGIFTIEKRAAISAGAT